MAIKFLNTVAVDTDVLYVDTTNDRVGIGTTSPQAKLDVDGDIFLASRHVKISSNGINVYFTAATHDASGTEGLLNKLSFKSVGTYFDNNFISITDTSVALPLATSIVQEAISSGDNNWNVLTLPKESGTFALENWVTSNFAPSTGGSYLPLSAGDSYPLTGNLVIEGNAKVLRLKRDADQSWIQYIGSNDDFIIRDETDSRSAFVAKGSGDVYFPGGNVGIGTDVPSSKLEVAGIVKINTAADSSNPRLYFQHDDIDVDNFIEVDRGTNAMEFWNNGSERMRITSSGNVGIGTTSPLQPFQVDAGSNIASFRSVGTGENNKELLIQTGGDRVTLDAKNADDGTATSLSFELGNSEKARLTTTGLGIGTTSPAAKLEVKKSSYNAVNAIANFVNGNDPVRVSYDTVVIAQTDVPTLSIVETIDGSQANEQKLTFSVGDNKAVIASTSTATGGMYFNVNRDVDAPGYNTGNGITALKISNNGNVGIGTNSPNDKLNIHSSDASDNIGLKITRGTQTHGLRLGVNNSHAFLWTTEPQDIAFGTNDSQRVTIKSNGNVGIGTTSPSEKLDVVGNIELNGVLYIGSRGIYQQQNTDVSGLELVANASTSLYRAAFFDYVIQKQGNVRAGTVFACNDGTSVEYTETSTNDIGDTSDVVLSVDISGTNMRLLADAATSGWSVKSLIRAI